MKVSLPRAVFLIFAFAALSYALPEHLVTRQINYCWYYIWLIRRLWYIIWVWCRLRWWIRTYDGTLVAYQLVSSSTLDWTKTIQNATIAHRAIPSGSMTVEDGKQLVDVFSSDYEPELLATINEFIGKQKAFASSGRSQALGQQFKWVQGNQTILNNAVLSNLPNDASVRSGAQNVINKINSDIASLVAAYPA